jgi:TonB family protein
VQAAKLIKQVPPVYPEIAKKAGVSGMVMLHAVIGKDGSVEQVGFVFGSLLLLKSTVDAVRQWTYQPTVLQGEPVEVDTTITVVYRLSGLSGTVLDGSEQQSQEVPQRVRVAEKAMGARMIKKGKPKYPKEAKKAGIGGTVVLHVVVAEDGNIEEVHYVSGPGELSQAAIDAVQEWCYQPIVLNGKPVQADTTIDIVFSP